MADDRTKAKDNTETLAVLAEFRAWLILSLVRDPERGAEIAEALAATGGEGKRVGVSSFTVTSQVIREGVELPTAELVLPLGMRLNVGTVVLPKHYIELLEKRPMVSIWVQTDKPNESKKERAEREAAGDTGRKMVFCGYIRPGGVSLQRTGMSMALSVSLVHWMDDLRTGSAYVGPFSPGVAEDLFPPQIGNKDGATVAVTPEQVVTGADLLEHKDDLWSLVRAKLVELIGSAAALAGNTYFDHFVGEQVNRTASNALLRVTGSLTFHAHVAAPLRESIAREVARILLDPAYGGRSIYDKLISVASVFRFLYVPSPTGLRAVAGNPVLPPSQYVQQISASEIVTEQRIRGASRQYRGIILIAPSMEDTAGAVEPTENTTVQAIPHAFAFAQEGRGVIDLVPIPDWLRVGALEPVYWPEPTGSGVRPGRGRGPAPASARAGVATDGDALRDAGSAWAQALYYDKLYGHNTTTFRGPLRLRLTPGLPVLFKMPGDDTVLMYGVIDRVTHTLDITTSAAYTTCTVYALRTAAEAEKNYMAAHPLFTGVYAG